MKKIIFTLFVAFLATIAAKAQQISVVSTTGATKLFRTLPDAINGADPGSVIYLPGGGFTISDDVKITKKLTIIGIGHYVKSDNVDGNTSIGGNLHFHEGSSGSAVMGCYITGNVDIGGDGKAVSDVLIRYCNLNAVMVQNNLCKETIVNQNYIREISDFYGSNAEVTNNIMHSIFDLDDGKIANNVILHTAYVQAYGHRYYKSNSGPFGYCERTQIMNNVLRAANERWYNDSSNALSGNLAVGTDVVEHNLGADVDWNDVFVNYNNATISPESDFHFSEKYKEYESKVGIYAGTSFNPSQMAPVPYISHKDIPQETDAQGMLNVKIRVKANK